MNHQDQRVAASGRRCGNNANNPEEVAVNAGGRVARAETDNTTCGGLFESEADIPAVLGRDDPRRMFLTRDERERALAIKETIEGLPDLDDLPDFWYAQLAVRHGSDQQARAVESAYALQETRKEYRILDTCRDGRRRVADLLEINPGMNLAFSFSNADGCYVMVYDYAKMDTPKILRNPLHTRTAMAGGYYQLQALNPDFASTRVGAAYIAECEGYHWVPRRGDLRFHETYWTQLGGVYPHRLRDFKCFNTPTMLNVFFAMGKPFTPKEVRDKISVGCRFERRLDEYYAVPSLEAAAERYRREFGAALQKRYDNEASFRLEGGAEE